MTEDIYVVTREEECAYGLNYYTVGYFADLESAWSFYRKYWIPIEEDYDDLKSMLEDIERRKDMFKEGKRVEVRIPDEGIFSEYYVIQKISPME